MVEDTLGIRRLALRAAAVGLSLAALAAIVALLSGDDTELHDNVILTSLAFSFATLMAAPGGVLLQTTRPALRALGATASVLAASSFALTVVPIWFDLDSDSYWKWWGVTFVLALATAHAAVMLGSRRPDDSETVTVLTWSSIGLGAADAAVLIGAILELAEDPGDTAVRIFAAFVVLLLLTTVLAPLIRRIGSASVRSEEDLDLAAASRELLHIATRLDRADALAAAEAARLRAIAEALHRAAAR